MAKTWSGRPREIEIRPVVQHGLPAAVIAYIVMTIISLSVTFGTAIWCIAHPAQESYSIPVPGVKELPVQTPDGH